jgi:hypothetical protein
MPTYVRSGGNWLAVSGSTSVSNIPSGSLMLFQQTTAPAGWTKQTTHNDKALRVVSGTAGSGGSTAFTSAFASRTISGTVGNTTLAANQLGNHTHYFVDSNDNNLGQIAQSYYAGATANSGRFGSTTGGINEGSGNAHTHGFSGTADFAVQYVDLIIARKD